jgi:DNA polymerase III delta subunit
MPKGTFMITTLAGANAHLLQTELQKITHEFIAEQGDLALEKFDALEGLELNRLLDAVQSMPFLASKKLVIVRDLGQNKPLSEAIEIIAKAVAESTELLLYESKLDKRTAYAKYLQKHTTFKSFEEHEKHQQETLRRLEATLQKLLSDVETLKK